MVENYLNKNYLIKNNKIVSKRFIEEPSIVSLVFELKQIFFLSESDSLNYVINFVKNFGYDLNNDYAHFDDSIIKINDFNVTTRVEEMERSIFQTRIIGMTKTEMAFKVIDENSINIVSDKCSKFLKNLDATAPIRYNMYYKGFYYSNILIKSMYVDLFEITINADVGFFELSVIKGE